MSNLANRQTDIENERTREQEKDRKSVRVTIFIHTLHFNRSSILLSSTRTTEQLYQYQLQHQHQSIQYYSNNIHIISYNS